MVVRKHFTNGGLGIRPFIDLWLLRHKTQFDDSAVREMCAECGILTFYEECCRLSEVWLGKAEHSETTKLLESFCLMGGVYGSNHFKDTSRQREIRGWRYNSKSIFPPISEVKASFPDNSGKNHSSAYYYGKRLVHWLGHKKRAELKNPEYWKFSPPTQSI